MVLLTGDRHDGAVPRPAPIGVLRELRLGHLFTDHLPGRGVSDVVGGHRSEERRVGKEGKGWWARSLYKKKKRGTTGISKQKTKKVKSSQHNEDRNTT